MVRFVTGFILEAGPGSEAILLEKLALLLIRSLTILCLGSLRSVEFIVSRRVSLEAKIDLSLVEVMKPSLIRRVTIIFKGVSVESKGSLFVPSTKAPCVSRSSTMS